ncbi:hypothetical protein ERO13_D02G094951v2 [Gossypium hirsutum]|nr:hypothetical protein ERO13_D02G094951v2 [Gossypium hirsutum]
MAKIALPLLLSLSLVLSNQSIVGDEEELAPEPTEQNTSEYADATGESLSTSLESTDGGCSLTIVKLEGLWYFISSRINAIRKLTSTQISKGFWTRNTWSH